MIRSCDPLVKRIKMFLLSLLISFFVFNVQAGELLIFKSPPSIKFFGGDSINENVIPEVFSAAMGFTTQGVPKWNGMAITSPFGFAKGVVVLYIEGAVTLGEFEGYQKFVVHNNENNVNIWKTLRNRIMDRYPAENNTIVKFELECTEEVPMKYSDKNSEDVICLKESDDLKKELNKIRNLDGIPDLYWFNVRSSNLDVMYPLGTKEKVYELLSKLEEIYSTAYEDQALIVALTGETSYRRRVRSVSGEKPSNISGNIEDNIYDPDFPVIFNIILWFIIALFFSLLSVSIFIASMDPGRDSIIYRMTSNRMKKDS